MPRTRIATIKQTIKDQQKKTIDKYLAWKDANKGRPLPTTKEIRKLNKLIKKDKIIQETLHKKLKYTKRLELC